MNSRAVLGLLVICAGLPLGGQQSRRPAGEKSQEVSADSYEVYSAVLSQKYSSWFKTKRPVRIAVLTSPMPAGARMDDCRARVGQEEGDVQLLNGLLAANTSSHRIEQKLTINGTYALIRGKTHIENGEVPGVVWLSAVGFSQERRHAMVYVRNYWGPLCATGSLWKLVKYEDGWRVTSNSPICGFIS